MSRSRVKLIAVPDAPPVPAGASEPRPSADIYAGWKAEIEARDWRKVHIAADRRQPVFLTDAVSRCRGGRAITIRPHLLEVQFS